MDKWEDRGSSEQRGGSVCYCWLCPALCPCSLVRRPVPTLSHWHSSAVVTKPRVSRADVAGAHTSRVSASEGVLFRSSGAI